jgi:hypothetical protein
MLARKTLPLPRTASAIAASTRRLGTTRHRIPRRRIRRCPPEALRYSLLLDNESSRRPLSPPSWIQWPVTSEEPCSPTVVPLSPPTSHLAGMTSWGKRRCTSRRASPRTGEAPSLPSVAAVHPADSSRAPSALPASSPSATPPAKRRASRQPRACCGPTTRGLPRASQVL